jgi:hypothetical protein
MLDVSRAVVEMPQMSVLYGRHIAGMGRMAQNKIAMNVGQNIRLAQEIMEKLRSTGVHVQEVKPRFSATKWEKDRWRLVFSFLGRLPSEHARDAAVLALQWENWVGWKFSK